MGDNDMVIEEMSLADLDVAKTILSL